MSGTRVRNRDVRKAHVDEFRTLRAHGTGVGVREGVDGSAGPGPATRRARARAGVDRVWTDHASGTVANRPQLAAVLDYTRAGDVLVVRRLDRLGRSVQHLVATVTDLAARGVELRSLSEGIDTTSPPGRLTFHIFAAVAEFEADLIRGRTVAGLAAARARGRVGGRPSVMTPEKRAAADELMRATGATVTGVARALVVSRSAVYRYLQAQDSGAVDAAPARG